MEKFVARNGREVLKTVTESGVVGFMDASIPVEALGPWRERLRAAMASNTAVSGPGLLSGEQEQPGGDQSTGQAE